MSISDKDLPGLYASMFRVVNSATTPWQYVTNWEKSDKGPHETLEALNERMQNRWPGKYKIVKDQRWNGNNYWINVYEFRFDTAAEETLFRIKYS